MIEVDNLSKHFIVRRGRMRRERYVVEAVRDISFRVERGELLGYLGPNGAGKSTTIKMLTGILVPTSGRVAVAGLDPSRRRLELARRIGAMFGQRVQLWWDLPLVDSFELLRHIYRVPVERYRSSLARFREVLDLDPFLHTPVRQLSLGQRIRGELTASMLHEPELLFLDEPTLGLDPDVAVRVRAHIARLRREQGITIVLTTHYMREADELCDEIAFIKAGRILARGTSGELKRQIRLGEVIALKLDPPRVPWLAEAPGVLRCVEVDGWVECTVDEAEKRLPELVRALVTEGVVIRNVQVREPELEEVFVELAK
jgi:ABC-2 type transport system ATP-binding protein